MSHPVLSNIPLRGYRKLLLIIIVLFPVVLSSCYYDKEAIIYPANTSCDTSKATYSLTVVPLLKQYCLGCHGNNNYNTLGGNVNLDGYNNVSVQANNGSLLNSIEYKPGYSPMPKNAAKLSDCDIARIKNWVSSGARNN